MDHPRISERFQAVLSPVRRLLRANRVSLAYLFGSVARGEERPDSDLDVAVLFDAGVRPENRGTMRIHLTTELIGLTHANDVDVVVLNEAPPLLSFQVISTGELIHGEEIDRIRFESAAIKRYIDTRLLRRRSEERFRERLRSAGARPGEGRW